MPDPHTPQRSARMGHGVSESIPPRSMSCSATVTTVAIITNTRRCSAFSAGLSGLAPGKPPDRVRVGRTGRPMHLLPRCLEVRLWPQLSTRLATGASELTCSNEAVVTNAALPDQAPLATPSRRTGRHSPREGG